MNSQNKKIDMIVLFGPSIENKIETKLIKRLNEFTNNLLTINTKKLKIKKIFTESKLPEINNYPYIFKIYLTSIIDIYLKYKLRIFFKLLTKSFILKNQTKLLKILKLINSKKKIVFINYPLRSVEYNFENIFLFYSLKKMGVEIYFLRESYINFHLRWRVNLERTINHGANFETSPLLINNTKISIGKKFQRLVLGFLELDSYKKIAQQSVSNKPNIDVNKLNKINFYAVPMMKINNKRGLFLGFDTSLSTYLKIGKTLKNHNLFLCLHPLDWSKFEEISNYFKVLNNVKVICNLPFSKLVKYSNAVIGGPSHALFQSIFHLKPVICLSKFNFLEKFSPCIKYLSINDLNDLNFNELTFKEDDYYLFFYMLRKSSMELNYSFRKIKNNLKEDGILIKKNDERELLISFIRNLMK